MKLKKDRGRFTVRFDMENPDHVRAVEYLERQRDRGKAQYLTDAILCYEKAETKSFPQTAPSTNATTEGVVRLPSLFAITTGSLPSNTETQEFVVPKSIPIIFPMIVIIFICYYSNVGIRLIGRRQ